MAVAVRQQQQQYLCSNPSTSKQTVVIPSSYLESDIFYLTISRNLNIAIRYNVIWRLWIKLTPAHANAISHRGYSLQFMATQFELCSTFLFTTHSFHALAYSKQTQIDIVSQAFSVKTDYLQGEPGDLFTANFISIFFFKVCSDLLNYFIHMKLNIIGSISFVQKTKKMILKKID